MITLNDYLYSGDTVLKILIKYSADLKEEAIKNHNPIDLAHSNFLMQIIELLEHTDFLSSQSQRIKDFYLFMTQKYPFLAFTFKGRIKSLIRSEEKFNGYIIAYRIVISLPQCHVLPDESQEEQELKYLYEIANIMPDFLEEKGFSPRLSEEMGDEYHGGLNDNNRPYYRDYVQTPRLSGYRSLHITFYDNLTRCYTELQLRTKDMDDYAEIGDANHFGYEKSQEVNRTRRDIIQKGECRYFDEAYDRLIMLQELDLSKINVNMFKAYNNQLINDGCGLFRGRQILPFEHLSRFQNDLIL